MQDILKHISDNVWAILQTILGGVAICLAYKIGKRQILLNAWYITYIEIQKKMKEYDEIIPREKDPEKLKIYTRERILLSEEFSKMVKSGLHIN